MLVFDLACAALVLTSLGGSSGEEVFVSGYNSDAVHRFAQAGGAPLGDLPGIAGAQSLHYGPDGVLYACAEKAQQVLRFDAATLAPLGVIVGDDPLTPQDESGGLDGPTAAVVGPDGALYVASFETDSVKRYDRVSGAYLGDFVAPASGTLNGPDAGLCFGPDGALYVPSYWNNKVLRYDGASGAFLDAFVTQLEGPLSRPRSLRFRSDGVLFVSCEGNGRIQRYDLDGVFAGTFASTGTPTGFQLDALSGDVYVASSGLGTVRHFDGASGALLGTLVPSGSGGMSGPVFLELWPDRALHLDRPVPGAAGALNQLRVRNATPGGEVLLGLGFAAQSQAVNACGTDLYWGIAAPLFVPLAADGTGTVQLDVPLGPEFAGLELYLCAFDSASCRASNLVFERF